MIGNLLVGIALRFNGLAQGVAGMESLDIATKRAALSMQIAKKEIQGLDIAIARNSLANESIALRQQRIMDQTAQKAGRMRAMVAGAFALGGSAIIIAAIDQAAKFQQAMTSVQAATGASASQFAMMQRLAITTSGVTAQSSSTIASELAAAATSGLNRPGRLMAAFPQLARAADVMMLSPKHIDPVEAVTQLSKLSHLFGAYSGAPLHNMVDAATRLMFTQPESLTKLINQGKYFIPTALAAGISMKDIFTETMSMSQLGLMSGRGGTSLRSFIQFMLGSPMITEYRSKKQLEGFEALHLYDRSGHNRFVRPDGTLDLEGAIGFLGKERPTMKPSDFVSDVFKAFGQMGAQYIIPVTAAYAMKQRGENFTAFNRIAAPGQAVETLWGDYQKTFLFQWRNFTTNFANLGQSIFLPILPPLTEGLKDLAGGLGAMTNFFMANPTLAVGTAVTAIGSVAASAVYATASLLAFNRAILAIGASSNVSSAGSMAGVMGRWLPLLGKISAWLSLLYFLDSSKASGKKGTPAGEPSWTGLSGMSNDRIRDYIHRTGWGNVSPDVRDHWRNIAATFGPAGPMVSQGRYGSGGAAFDKLHRQLVADGFNPVVRAISGGSDGSSMTAAISRSSKSTSEPIVNKLGPKLDAIVDALSNLGVNITVPGVGGQPGHTFHELLRKSGAPVSRGNPAHPQRSGRW
ncbi:MAG: phage tail tape measure protein [Candidatus Cybelea sp.]